MKETTAAKTAMIYVLICLRHCVECGPTSHPFLATTATTLADLVLSWFCAVAPSSRPAAQSPCKQEGHWCFAGTLCSTVDCNVVGTPLAVTQMT